MKNITKLFLYLNLCLTLLACSKISPKGEIEVKDVTVENFTKLNLKGDFKVLYDVHCNALIHASLYLSTFQFHCEKVIFQLEDEQLMHFQSYSIYKYENN
jgi:hypothetical protein